MVNRGERRVGVGIIKAKEKMKSRALVDSRLKRSDKGLYSDILNQISLKALGNVTVRGMGMRKKKQRKRGMKEKKERIKNKGQCWYAKMPSCIVHNKG